MLAFAFTLLLAATSVFAAPKHSRGCGTTPSSEEVAKAEGDFSRLLEKNGLVSSNLTIGGSYSFNPPIEIPVYWHVIRKDRTHTGGSLTATEIAKQIRVLNRAFSPAHITFKLERTDYMTNVDWFNGLGPNNTINTVAKYMLHRGGKDVLNVYSTGFVTGSGAGLLGYATFPYQYAGNDDGVVILHSSLPGGSTVPYNLGYTLVHEVGHWVGLYHTFQNGCSLSGDFVYDTPAEASPAFGCPTGRNTCTGMPGADPIHNYMDYTKGITEPRASDQEVTASSKDELTLIPRSSTPPRQEEPLAIRPSPHAAYRAQFLCRNKLFTWPISSESDDDIPHKRLKKVTRSDENGWELLGRIPMDEVWQQVDKLRNDFIAPQYVQDRKVNVTYNGNPPDSSRDIRTRPFRVEWATKDRKLPAAYHFDKARPVFRVTYYCDGKHEAQKCKPFDRKANKHDAADDKVEDQDGNKPRHGR
ncbi:hypothetical protein FRB99_004513 [Tulasnella sp. 403]|nr:hypothetical protein FRB99_004513 [Tulasnella sp. 403]